MDISGYPHALATLILGKNPGTLKQEPGWTKVTVWAFWRTEKSFVPTRIRIPNHPDGGIDAILTTLPRSQNFTLEQAMMAGSGCFSLWAETCTGDWVGTRTILVRCRKSSAYNGIQSLDPPVCSKSLYPLCWPGQQNIKNKMS
jgi:hypothetical protein